MKILIVHAHENPDSFCTALLEKAQKFFSDKGHHVVVSDLYKMPFNPIGGKHDFTQLSNSSHYKYANEQLHATNIGGFSDELKKEMKHLEDIDTLIFNFPLWWFGMPAILKGWVDRVLAYGFAYGGQYGMGPNGKFAGKKAFLNVTTGSPESLYQENNGHHRTIENILLNINKGILELVGFEVLPSHVSFGVSRVSQEEREKMLNKYEAYLNTYF